MFLTRMHQDIRKSIVKPGMTKIGPWDQGFGACTIQVLSGKEADNAQSTRRWIEEKVKSFRESEVLPFHEILSADMVKSAVRRRGSNSRIASIRLL